MHKDKNIIPDVFCGICGEKNWEPIIEKENLEIGDSDRLYACGNCGHILRADKNYRR